jgi:hypothetical protein
MLLALMSALILAGLIKWSANEREITERHVAMAKARLVAESVDQYGAAQIKARLDRLTYFADDEFRPDPARNNNINVSSLVHELLETNTGGGIGQLLKELKGNRDEEGPAEPQPLVPTTEGYFRYQVTPDNLVIGRFSPARWELVDDANPLYEGDPLVDQTVRVREVRMVSSAKAVDSQRDRTLWAFCESYLQVRDAPVWGHVLFYNMDLEVAPGPLMEIQGPVHTNGNLYVQSDHAVRFHDSVTAAGQVIHGRTTGADGVGTVHFRKAGTSTFVSMQQDGVWLDSRASDWAAKSSTLWAGALRSREHGINPAYPAGVDSYRPDDPATTANEWQNPAHVLIRPAVENTSSAYPGDSIEIQKFSSKACLVFEVNTLGTVSLYKYERSNSGRYVRDAGLGPQKYIRKQLNVPAQLVVGGVAADRFYDMRRGRWISTLDLDVGRLKTLVEQSGEAAAFRRGNVSFDPATEWNGIVYVSHGNASRGGVRLVNGRYIPSRPTSANGNTPGFTLATDAPLYILGHYNADGVISGDSSAIRQPDSSSEPPAGLAADAVTILSPAWSDANSDRGLSARRATPTEIAAAILAGLVPTNKNGNGIYSGGVQNLPRFLENWSGVAMGYRGSMVVLYESERATEPWGASNIYYPPDRTWGFNALFADGVLPPGTPYARSYRRIGFRDLQRAEYEEALQAINDE